MILRMKLEAEVGVEQVSMLSVKLASQTFNACHYRANVVSLR
jgi:hypothetical protein